MEALLQHVGAGVRAARSFALQTIRR